MTLGHGGMVPRGAPGRSGLYWDVLGCPGIAVRHSMMALSCREKSLTQTGAYCNTLERYWVILGWKWTVLECTVVALDCTRRA